MEHFLEVEERDLGFGGCLAEQGGDFLCHAHLLHDDLVGGFEGFGAQVVEFLFVVDFFGHVFHLSEDEFVFFHVADGDVDIALGGADELLVDFGVALLGVGEIEVEWGEEVVEGLGGETFRGAAHA